MYVLKEILYSSLLAFIISAMLGPIVIILLKKFKVGQSVRAEGPKSHLKKSGIPTIGGMIFLVPISITALIVGKVDGTFLLLLLAMLGFGLIGLVDDVLKIRRNNSEGLNMTQKFISQIILATIFTFVLVNRINPGTDIIMPFMEKTIDLKWAYIPAMIFFVLGTVNGVNFTDGLDGLASVITIVVGIFFCFALLLIYVQAGTGISLIGNSQMNYHNIGVFCGALCGGLFGFLIYNFHPAKVIMGDTGSQALGGAVAAIAIMLKLPVFLAIVGFIYAFEIISVILQVASFKFIGKRVFKMAPVHHHFELCGWSENKVVAFFTFITAILCVAGVFSL